MSKMKISNNAFVYPMPMVLVGVEVDGKANFMPVGWVSRVNNNPPMVLVALGKRHHTNKGIKEHQVYSVNIPSIDLMAKTDYCGLVSGEKIDKANVFTVFTGDLVKAPMIKECPISMECRVVKIVELETNELFIAEIVNAYSEEQYLENNKPDINKINPFVLTMPDNNYWSVGNNLGKAWSLGRKLQE